MHGSLIGLVPKHFIIVLIENHCWYEHSRTTKGKDISSQFSTHNQREGDIEEQTHFIGSLNNSKNPQLTHSESIESLELKQTVSSGTQQTMKKYTGETDLLQLPMTKNICAWHKFNVDFWSTQRTYEEVIDIASRFNHKLIDLRPYMIQEPYIVHSTDKLPKVLDMFRHFHLRALPVLDPNNGLPVAVLTRQDLFAWMAL